MKLLCIFYFFYLLYFVSSAKVSEENNDKTEGEVFRATNEWQVVKKGQPIPKGLHVRINLETGLTEAKLLEEELKDEKKSALLTINQPQKEDETSEPEAISKETLKEALKNIKNEDLAPDDEEAIKRVTSKFKKYEEIKKDLEDINLTPKTDVELLRELFKKYDETILNKKLDSSIKNIHIYNILEDIEYLVHQIDNANEFTNLDGFKKIIYNNFNSTNPKIKCQVLNILGSSVQNNPKAQIQALETGGIDKLLRLLALETNNDVLSRTIYAISSLLRRFPLAQQHFINNGGLSVFAEIFEKLDKLKIQIRIITLLYDLLIEQTNAIKHTENPDYKLKLQQYTSVDLKKRLKDLKWCEIFTNVLKNVLNTDENDHDSIEKCINMMNLLQDICVSSYNTTELRKMFYDLNTKYANLAEKELKENSDIKDETERSNYFQKMKEIIETLVNKLNVKTEL